MWSKKASNHLMVTVLITIGLILTGCSQKYSKSTTTGYVNVPKQYQVQSGDTVAKIAQRYGLDWRSLSKTNKLNENHTIYVGQWLVLKGVNRAEPQKNTKKTSSTPYLTQKVVKQPTLPQTTLLSSSQSIKPPEPRALPAPAQMHTTILAPTPTQSKSSLVGSSGLMQFSYPVSRNNPVVKNFASPTQNGLTEGIFFSGRDGDKVTASMAGKVVSLDSTAARPFVILEHNNGYQTTYFDLKNIPVRMGQTINKNDTLGVMQSQTPSGLALFEFRVLRQGQYIDPVSVLR